MDFDTHDKFFIENLLSRLVRTTPYIYTNAHTSSLSFSKLVEWRLKKNNSFDNQKVSGNDPLHISTWVELHESGKEIVDKFFQAFQINPFDTNATSQICYVHRLVSYLKKIKWDLTGLDVKEAFSKGDFKLRYKYFGTDEDDLAKVPFLFDTRTVLTELTQESYTHRCRDVLRGYREGDESIFFLPKKGHLKGTKLFIPVDQAQRIIHGTKSQISVSLVLSMDILNAQELIKRLNKEEMPYEDGYLLQIKGRTIRIYPYFTCEYCTAISSRLNFFIPF